MAVRHAERGVVGTEVRRRATGAWPWAVWVSVLVMGIGCGEPEPGPSGAMDGGTSTGAASETEADTSGGESSSTTWMLPDVGPPMPQQTASCSAWVACATELGVEGLAEIEASYGLDGTCWDGDGIQAAACDDECKLELDATEMELEAMGQAVPEVCDPPQMVSWGEIEAIIDANCVTACHEPGGEDMSLDMSGSAYYEIYGVASSQSLLFLVEAGSHEDSYLWHKVNGSQGSVGGSGSTMPKGAPMLTADDIEKIGAWIDGGAQPF
jgi:hypothetical protein